MSRKALRASVHTDAPWLVGVLFVTTLAVAACDHAASPVAPTASDDVTSPVLQLSGAVVDRGAGSPVVGARVEVVDGVNQSKAATTDGNGRYVLADLQAGSLSLRAAADGFGAASQALTLTSDNVVNFDLTRQTAGGPPPTDWWSLSGTVTDSTTRAGVAGARIEFTDGFNKGQAATSDIQGRYRLSGLAPGTSVLRARRDGYLEVSQSVTIDSDRVFDVSFQRESSPAPSGPDVAGRTVDAISQRPLAGVLVRIEGLGETTTGGDGRFDLAAQAAVGSRAVTMRSAATVERQTRIRVPGDAATLTLIPQSLNLGAFDEMFRGRGALHRWVSAPQLVVQRRVLRFTNTSDESYVATAGLMSDAEVSDLVRDLTWTLPQLTGDTFGGFAGVHVETAAENDAVSVSRSGTIVVARYDGLTAASSYWGYSRWAWNGPGEIQVGILMIDKDFDTSGSEFRRSLRAHELGHTLGYDHVTACPSVMNAAARIEPNAFDRDGAKIAFLRQPFNQSPDIDPDPTTISRMRVKGLSWASSH